MHLRRAAFEQPAATAGEEGVAAEQHAFAKVGDMARGVRGNVENAHPHSDTGHVDLIVLHQVAGHAGYRFPLGSEYRYVILRQQIRDSADVVCVMVGGEDGFELQALGLEVFEDGAGFTRIDDHRAAIASQAPDVVVLERPYGLDDDGIHAGIFIIEPLNVK